MNERCLTAITITLLMLLVLAPAIALPNQPEVKLNNSLKITADSNSEINESNETNNNTTITATAREVSVIHVPTDYPTIQEAIDNATDGDTIIVGDGNYSENINVNKPLTLRSENGSAYTFIQAKETNRDVFKVVSDWVNITGFTIAASPDWVAGIHLKGVRHCNISNNSILNSYYGIYLDSSSENSIIGNNMSDNTYNIYLYLSSYNIITRNNVAGIGCAISGMYSSNNKFYLNNFLNTQINIYRSGIWNSSTPITYTYNNSTHMNYMGNYWSDYEGYDRDGDGIGDEPYNITTDGEDKDFHPLIEPFENYHIQPERIGISVTVVIRDAEGNLHVTDVFSDDSVINATSKACEELNISFEFDGKNITIDGLDNPLVFLYNETEEEWTNITTDYTLNDADIIGWSNAYLPSVRPDLTPEDITITSYQGKLYAANVTNKINVAIRNSGIANASNLNVVFKANDTAIDNETIEHINRTDAANISFDWIPNQTGNYTLSVEIDPGNKIAELNESNNEITKNVTVEVLPSVVHVSSIEELQDMINISPTVVGTYGWMTIYLDEGSYEKEVTEEQKEEHIEIISLKDKQNLTICGNENAIITIEETCVIGTAWPGAEIISISNSTNLELRGFTMEALWGGEYPDDIQNTRLIRVNNSNNITIKNVSFNHQSSRAGCVHIKIENSRDCVISDNFIKGGRVGIELSNADNNLIYNNSIILNISKYANSIHLTNSSNNTIYFNNLFVPARDDRDDNHWNSTVPVNYTYNGTIFTNYTGNFWFNYTGADNNRDGIGDVPYKVCDGNYDYYPLIQPLGLTFDIAVTAITRPYIVYAKRENRILVTIKRSGTYPSPEEVYVEFMVNDTKVDSKTVEIRVGENVVNFTWNPPDAGDYKLGIEVHPEDELISEVSYTNNNFSITVNVSPPLLFNYDDNISSALEFLNGEQLVTGNIWGFENSGWAALAIIAAGEDPSAGRWKPPGRDTSSLIEYLRKEPEDSAIFLGRGATPPCLNKPEDFARMVMVISAMGEDPTNFGDVNYLTMLKSYYDGEQFGKRDDVKDDALVILALISISSGDKDPRTEDMLTNASGYIEDRQNGDGGWGSFGAGSDVRTTSLVIQALIAAGEDKNSETIMNALNYLKNAQGDDGGYADVKATSYAIQAFIAAGEDLSNYNKTIDYLLSLQQPDGSFNYTANFSLFPPRTTAYPIPALCGEPYPVMIKTIRGDYELPDISVESIKLGEDEIYVNTSYTVKANIKSNGGIFYVDLLADGEFVEREKVYSVWHDSLTPVSFTWKPTATGSHNLTVFADSMNNVTESDETNETNNNATKKVNVRLPDLYPSVITPPERTYVNVTNVINCTIRGTTDESFNVTLEADGELIGNQRIEGIRDCFTLSFGGWRPSANRSYNLTLTVDSDGEVGERDEGNNTLETLVTVQLPDLMPTSIAAADEIFVNARNKVSVTVEGFAECFNISLVENGTVVGKRTNVTCYGKKNVSIEWKPASVGNHTITAIVDSDNEIEETKETNNNITATFEVLLPDLVPVAIEPSVYYIDEFNSVNVGVNGTAEGFNVTLLVNYIGVDRSGSLGYLIKPVVNKTPYPYKAIEIPATGLESNFTCNITDIKDEWSWEDIRKLDLEIGSVSETGVVDMNDSWSIDYVALIVNYTKNETLELAPSNVTLPGNWSNTSEIFLLDGVYARTTNITTLQVEMSDPSLIDGNITSVTVLLKGHVSNMHTPPAFNYRFHMKKFNTNTYNHTIGFGWVPFYEGIYNLTVFLDSDDDVNETNETNNRLSKEVLATKRIKLKLTSPVGSETWKGIQNITWSASYDTSLPYNATLRIDIFYSPDRGYRWIPIATNETNDGVYAWDTGNGEAPADPLDGEYIIMILAHPGEISWSNSQYFYDEITMTLTHTGKPWAMDMSGLFYIRNQNVGEEWGSFHANAGYAPCDGPDTDEIAWESDDIGASSSSSLIVADGKIFVYATGNHGDMISGGYTYLVALDEKTGNITWARDIASQQYGSWATPAYKDGSIFVASGGYLYRINANDGSIEWTYPVGSSVDASPAVTKRAIYVGDWDGGHYYCIKNNRTEPRELWNFSLGNGARAQATPAIAYGNVYFGSFCGSRCQSKAFCVDAVNGRTEIWSTPTGDICGSVTVADGIVYFTTYGSLGGDTFYALDAFNGSKVWENPIGWSDSTPAYYSPPKSKSTRSYIYVVIVHGFTEPADLHCFDAKTGEEIWNTGGKGAPSGIGYWTASPVVTRDGKVFVGNSTTLSCLDAFTGDILWQAPGGPSPIVTNGFVYTVHGGRVIKYGNGTLPDLTVKADAPDDEYVVGKKGNITAIIENIGKSNVTKSFKVELNYSKGLKPINITTVEASPESPFKVNDTKPISFEWIPPEWSTNEPTNLTVEVDPSNNVLESGLGDNNIDNVTVEVKNNKPDLVTKIENVSPNPAYVGDTATVEANITNIGYETNETFSAMFFVDGDQHDETPSLPVNKNKSQLLNFTWGASETGNHTLTVMAMINSDANYTNNTDSAVVEVKPTPTPTPSPTPTQTSPPGFGPGSGGGFGGGTAGGIGAGSGTGEAGAGKAGGMQIPVNASSSASETKKEVSGFPFGNASSGASGGGGTLPVLLMLLATLVIALFYFGYYKEKRAYRRK